jgi:ribosomal protein S18 acetylase RimI-like enzyme
MDSRPVNLARFVSAVSGRRGATREVRGGSVIACIVPVKNGYLDAAIPTDYSIDPSGFLDDAQSFFVEHHRPFVVWVPQSFAGLIAEVAGRGGLLDSSDTPAMFIAQRVEVDIRCDMRIVESAQDRATFAEVCERGYGVAGLGWITQHIEAFDADGTTWVVAFDQDEPVGVGCGFHDGQAGGIYYVATPAEHRGRGIAREVTAWLVNHLLDGGVDEVVLQSSKPGLPVYQRLGFETYDLYDRYVLDRAE